MVFGFAVPASASTTPVNAAGASYLNFSNTVKIGQGATPNFTTRYANVVNGVDALLTVLNTTSRTTINNVDRVSTKDNWQIWSNLLFGSGTTDEFANYRIDFVTTGTNNPVILQNFNISVGDIDAKQYVEFAGLESYLLSPNTALSVSETSGAFRFAEPAGQGDPTDADPRFLVQVNYSETSTVGIKIGAGSGGAALFQISFSSGNWGTVAPVTTTPPVNSVSYTVSYSNNGASGNATPSSTTELRGDDHIISAQGSTSLSGATFAGWNTRPDGSGVMYQPGWTILPPYDMTLYAIWDIPATVTFVANTGSGTPPSPIDPGGEPLVIPGSGQLFKDGYTFIGWNIAADGSNFPYEPGETIYVQSSFTLYAQWQEIPTPPGGLAIDTTPGSTTNGAEVPYNIPDLKPGELYAVEVIPTGNPTAAEEIDAGYADSSGNAIGSTTLPGGLGQGDYTVYFSGIDADGDPMQVVLPFSVGPNGSLDSQGTPTRSKVELAETGIPDAALPWLMSMAFIALILGAAGVVAAREIRKRRK